MKISLKKDRMKSIIITTCLVLLSLIINQSIAQQSNNSKLAEKKHNPYYSRSDTMHLNLRDIE
jgi:hypothetical protein